MNHIKLPQALRPLLSFSQGIESKATQHIVRGTAGISRTICSYVESEPLASFCKKIAAVAPGLPFFRDRAPNDNITHAGYILDMPRGSKEVDVAVHKLLGHIRNPGSQNHIFLIDMFRGVEEHLAIDSPVRAEAAETLRTLIGNPSVAGKAKRAYSEMIDQFRHASELVYREGKALCQAIACMDECCKYGSDFFDKPTTRILKQLGEGYTYSWSQRESYHKSYAADLYSRLVRCMKRGDAEVYEQARTLRGIMQHVDPVSRQCALIAYEALSENFEPHSEEFLRGMEAVKNLIEDDHELVRYTAIKVSGALAGNYDGDRAHVDECEESLRNLVRDGNVDEQEAAIKAYKKIVNRLARGSERVYRGAEAIRAAISGPNAWSAIEVYGDLSTQFEMHAPETDLGEAALLEAVKNESEPGASHRAVEAFSKLAMNYPVDAEPINKWAAMLRQHMDDETGYNVPIEAYGDLSQRFSIGGEEVQAGVQSLRDIMMDDDDHLKRLAIEAYAKLVTRFPKDARFLTTEADLLIGFFTRMPPEIRTHLLESLMRSFRSLALIGFWKAALDGDWLQHVTLFQSARNNLRTFGTQRHFIHHYDHWRLLLESVMLTSQSPNIVLFAKLAGGIARACGIPLDLERLRMLIAREKGAINGDMLKAFIDQFDFEITDDVEEEIESARSELDLMELQRLQRLFVLNAVFDETNSTSWNQVKKTLGVLKRLLAIQSLPQDKQDDFYSDALSLIAEAKPLRGELKRRSEQALLNYLADVFGDDPKVRALLDEDAPDMTENARGVQSWLIKTGTIHKLIASASFMEPEGLERLRVLVSDLAESSIENGELVYDRRYERMIDLGFPVEFVAGWRREFKHNIDIVENAVDDQQVHSALIKQAAEQLAQHSENVRGMPGKFHDLPDKVQNLVAKLEKDIVAADDIASLYHLFDLHYQAIRKTYGDLFANIRNDLKNAHIGLTKGVHAAQKSERVGITGRADAIANHGTIPVATCQRLTELYSEGTNGLGQPINKIIWGQFKIANYEIDGQIVARHLLEATMDVDGNIHLRVERMYVAGAFTRQEQFHAAILDHAKRIGISDERVHFLDRISEDVPLPLKTGDKIYRDSGEEEFDPERMRKKSSPTSIVDHLLPYAVYGKNIWDNTVAFLPRCIQELVMRNIDHGIFNPIKIALKNEG